VNLRNTVLASLWPGVLGGAVVRETPDWDALGKQWWAHIQFLANDGMEGRDTGSRGHAKAAEYMAEQFRAAGLQPAGTNGYRQSVDFEVTRIDEPHCSLELVRDGRVESLKLGDDAAIGVSTASAEKVEAPAVFVGYGLTVPELQYDDLAPVDVRDKIIVLISGGPASMPGPIKAHYQSLEERRKALWKAGVAGTVVIQNPKAVEIPWARSSKFRFQPRMELTDAGQEVPPPLPFAAVCNPDRAEVLFASSGHSFKEVIEDLQADRALPHFPLNITIRARQALTRTHVRSENVAGVLPGSDPALRKEFVVLSAHLDHIGIGEPINGDTIYSGAMDDASGDASLIEIAKSLHRSGIKPRRSLLFLSVTGEEKGLLGSQYYATHPTVSGPIVADLNMDMFNPLFPLKYLEVQGLGESTLGDDIRAVAEPVGVQVQPDQEPEHNLFIRSDQYSFIKTGVPALTFKFSYLPGTPEEDLFKVWLRDRYHAPLDDLEQPVDLAAAAQFNAILEKLTLRVADADARPVWNSDSFFRRFAR
jgi:hypothetical protein